MITIDPVSREGRRLRRLAVQQRIRLRRKYRGRRPIRFQTPTRLRMIARWYWAYKRGVSWIVTQDCAGIPVRYFCYDYEQVWRWSRSLSKASRFTTRDGAIRHIESTTMPYRHHYTVRRLNDI